MGTRVQRVLLVGGDSTVRHQLQQLLAAHPLVGEVRCLDRYPSADELARVVQLFPPHAIFLGLDSVSNAMRVVEELTADMPGTPVVAFNRYVDPRAMVDLMRAGVRESVKPPFDSEVIDQLLTRMANASSIRGPMTRYDNLCAFLPARAGAGTSTLACHLSHALAEPPRRVLLADFDLVSSPIRYLLGAGQGLTLRDVADLLDTMDSWRWQQTVARAGNLEALCAGRLNPRRPLRIATVRKLLAFAVPRYDMVCADLSGNMEAFSLEVLRSAGRILLVTTADAPSLGAARDKAEFLSTLKLGQRTSLLVRQNPEITVPPIHEIEKYCGVPVAGVFDYSNFQRGVEVEEGQKPRLPNFLRRQLVRFGEDLMSPPADGFGSPTELKRRRLSFSPSFS